MAPPRTRPGSSMALTAVAARRCHMDDARAGSVLGLHHTAKIPGLVIGWRDVPVHDSVKTIQQRSNSLFPYELLEIVQAKAEVVEDFAKFNILLKLKRGTKEEKMKAEVHKNLEGVFFAELHADRA